MSYITRRHNDLSKFQGTTEVLTNPEKYFGPNYKILINYWIDCEIEILVLWTIIGV
jgi:hypothetical protein